MTLEDLLGMSADVLEKMTDAQVQEYFTPMLQFTRPDKVIEANKLKPKGKVTGAKMDDEARERARKIAEQFGFDLGLED